MTNCHIIYLTKTKFMKKYESKEIQLDILLFAFVMIIAVICYYIVKYKIFIIGILICMFIIAIAINAVKSMKKQVHEMIDHLTIITFIVAVYAILVDLWTLMVSAVLGLTVITMKVITNNRYRIRKIFIDIFSWIAFISAAQAIFKNYYYAIIPVILIPVIIIMTKISKK